MYTMECKETSKSSLDLFSIQYSCALRKILAIIDILKNIYS